MTLRSSRRCGFWPAACAAATLLLQAAASANAPALRAPRAAVAQAAPIAAPRSPAARQPSLMPPLRQALVSSGFGWRINPLGRRRCFHKGTDFAAPRGTSVQAAAGGTVVALGTQHGYGRFVRIAHGGGIETIYAHLSRIDAALRLKGPVRSGQQIGAVGSSGRSTGPHLHFEVVLDGTPQDPQRYAQAAQPQLARAR